MLEIPGHGINRDWANEELSIMGFEPMRPGDHQILSLTP